MDYQEDEKIEQGVELTKKEQQIIVWTFVVSILIVGFFVLVLT